MSRNKKNWDYLVDDRGQYLPRGDKGSVGPKGQKGRKGEGQKGRKGDIGPKGEQGLLGQKGQKGLDGDGDKGAKGSKGAPGNVAVKGDKGLKGEKGFTQTPAGNEGDVQINTAGSFGSATTGTFNYVDADNALSIDNLKVLNEVSLIDDGGTSFISIAAPVSVTADYGIVLPADQATDVSTIINDGNGNLTWEDELDAGSF